MLFFSRRNAVCSFLGFFKWKYISVCVHQIHVPQHSFRYLYEDFSCRDYKALCTVAVCGVRTRAHCLRHHQPSSLLSYVSLSHFFFLFHAEGGGRMKQQQPLIKKSCHGALVLQQLVFLSLSFFLFWRCTLFWFFFHFFIKRIIAHGFHQSVTSSFLVCETQTPLL